VGRRVVLFIHETGACYSGGREVGGCVLAGRKGSFCSC
jgi:hypothetical protein